MRVALVTDYWLPTLGGVQTAVKAQREALEAAGHEVTVLCPRRPSDELDDGAVALPASPVFRPDGYPFAWSPRAVEQRLVDELRRRRVDVVHTHSEMFAALGALGAARRLGLPTVHTMHGRIDVYTRAVLPWPAVTMRLLARLHASRLSHRGVRVPGGTAYTATGAARAMWRVLVAQAQAVDAVVVPSDHLRRKLAAQGVTTPMTVLPNGLEPSVLTAIRAVPRRVRDPHGPLRLVWVGRLSPEKRPEVFVDAVARLGGAVSADLVGGGISAPAIARRAPGALRRHGAVPQSRVLALLADADLMVSTSLDFDNQPMALLEAVASGVPVLVCDPDLAEVVPPGTVFVAPTPDAEGVAAAVRDLAADRTRLARARASALSAAPATAVSADDLVSVYEQASARREVRAPSA